MYTVCPYSTIPSELKLIHEIKEICITRIKLYSILQEITYRFKPYSEIWQKNLTMLIRDHGLINFLVLLGTDPVISTKSIDDCLLDDYIGHYALAVVCSTENELANLFLLLETLWFQIRFILNVPLNHIEDFLNTFHIHVPKIEDPIEIKLVKRNSAHYSDKNEIWYKLPFYEVPEIMRQRKGFLNNGFMYFNLSHVHLFLEDHLYKSWKTRLTIIEDCHLEHEAMTDLINYLVPIVKEIVAPKISIGNAKLTLENINCQVDRYFPLCMLQMHKQLIDNSHLTHYGRFQYTNFLRHAGMPYEDAMKYLKKEFLKKFTENDFESKRYRYYFSYCYGKEGNRDIYNTPLSCRDMQDYKSRREVKTDSGCPFAYYKIEDLNDTLLENHIPATAIGEIFNFINGGHYGAACNVYFNSKLNCSDEDRSIISPTMYYQAAVNEEQMCSNFCSDIEDIEDIEDMFHVK